MRQVVVLGSTGSIGTQAIEVITARPEQFEVVGLAAGGSSIELLVEQARTLRPQVVAVSSPEAADRLAAALPGQEVWAGPEAATRLAAISADVVLNGITGAAGLEPTLATLNAGTTLALANKESLVIGGRLVTDAAAPGQIVAVDSEHSAFAQALRAGRAEEVRKLVLTASGGPFRGRTRAELRQVTPAQAMAHPTWDMGRVITINSATLVNKGLELLEAGLLYDVDLDAIEVVVHPQSIVHSMVEFVDGSTIAQCSPPDMRLPIALGLTWPDRLANAAAPCDWKKAATWTFEPLDSAAFPAVELAREAGKAPGGLAPAVYNAANEVCVDAFCAGRLEFPGIVDVVADVVATHLARHAAEPLSLAAVLAADQWARQAAAERISKE
ncbi:MAG TPA: 1-deoxy-D-xylulose-5-phosphate reductoisomerase [Propionicimonas sp.]|nr:1-deoxy-D-xylulose-5-phosphate reductoisomerase [Propionicimonas sp.]HQA77217.1 1-deoxy-D-xylulose-5-phosphate reductoisomerase [Propionicimonas sp.]HQD96833.1 1-deoxy-D-xylulose-5-phosphate reductoisomerase [Propionicimonas sp.]